MSSVWIMDVNVMTTGEFSERRRCSTPDRARGRIRSADETDAGRVDESGVGGFMVVSCLVAAR